jgi:hypothetical protein
MNESRFLKEIQNVNELSLKKIIDIAIKNLPIEKRHRPWSFINHGTDLLHTEDDLNCYLAAYGNMHDVQFFILGEIPVSLAEFLNPYQVDDRIDIEQFSSAKPVGYLFLDFFPVFLQFRITHRLKYLKDKNTYSAVDCFFKS